MRFIFCLFICLYGFSNTKAISIIAKSGDVEVLDSKQILQKLDSKVTPISSGSSVVTGKGGKCQILFSDSSILTMEPECRVKIDKYSFNDKNGVLKVTVLAGVVKMYPGKIYEKDPSKVTIVSKSTEQVFIEGKLAYTKAKSFGHESAADSDVLKKQPVAQFDHIILSKSQFSSEEFIQSFFLSLMNRTRKNNGIESSNINELSNEIYQINSFDSSAGCVDGSCVISREF